MKKGDKVRILAGDYKGVIATIDSIRDMEKGFWADYNIYLFLPLEYVPDGLPVPFWKHEIEEVND